MEEGEEMWEGEWERDWVWFFSKDFGIICEAWGSVYECEKREEESGDEIMLQKDI